jgi:hypothetical protein
MRAKCHSERSGARIFVGRSSRESHGHQELSRVNKSGRAATKSKNLSLAFFGCCSPRERRGSILCSPGRPRPARGARHNKRSCGALLARETRSGSKGVSKGGFSHSLASAVTPRSIATRNLLFIFAFIVAAPLPAALPLRTNDQSVCLHVSPPNPSYANRRARCRIFSRECIGGTGTPACAGSPRRQHVFWSNWRD